jgi:putative endonuclease
MDLRTSFGRQGEELAAHHYESLGFTVLDRNYRCSEGEIDVVVGRGHLIIFCEVKTRRSSRWGEPSEAVGWRKQQRLRRLAACWLADRRPDHREVRFDVVSVVVGEAEPEVTLIPDAF